MLALQACVVVAEAVHRDASATVERRRRRVHVSQFRQADATGAIALYILAECCDAESQPSPRHVRASTTEVHRVCRAHAAESRVGICAQPDQRCIASVSREAVRMSSAEPTALLRDGPRPSTPGRVKLLTVQR